MVINTQVTVCITLLKKKNFNSAHHLKSSYAKGSFRLSLFLLKLKTETEKHCSKIIFKCVNSAVRPIFNEKVAEK